MQILTLTLLTLASIKHLSMSVRHIVIGFNISSFEPLISISGLLWRSTVWEGKFRMHVAASRVDLTQFKYGRRVLDYKCGTGKISGRGSERLQYEHTTEIKRTRCSCACVHGGRRTVRSNLGPLWITHHGLQLLGSSKGTKFVFIDTKDI